MSNHADSSVCRQVNTARKKAGGERVDCFVTIKRQAGQGPSPQEGRDGTRTLGNSNPRSHEMIFSYTFRQTAAVGVVNLPRSSVGSGETIARSRNRERRPRRPLPRDYINTSRRLRIGRCPPPFLAVHPTRMDVWNATWGPLRVDAAYDYRKHHPSSHLDEKIFRAA